VKTLRRTAALVIGAWMVAAAPAAAQSPRDLLELTLPPELVLGEAEAIGLSAAQRQAVQRIQSELRPALPPLLRRIREERDALVTLLRAENPDEDAVLRRFESLDASETELKRLRLRMTVAIKRVLTAEQQSRAQALQAKRLADGGAGMGPESLPEKLRRVKEGLEQWKREGRDVTPLRELWDRFREAEDKGFYRQARQALDEALALLDAPPARR
jgi:Spy/CpxP family protein refolding chaperone